jgi:hypothetical protein
MSRSFGQEAHKNNLNIFRVCSVEDGPEARR